MANCDYLVNYGLGSYLGRFTSSFDHARGDAVVLSTTRGLELGTLLQLAAGTVGPANAGTILRSATAEDQAIAAHATLRAGTIVAEAQRLADERGLPLLFLDGEILLDAATAILQAVHWSDCEATELFEELSRTYGLHVQLADLTARPAPVEASGCSTCGSDKAGGGSCGTGGGCSTGSCSKGSVKSADELTSYFAGLRKAMEATADRVSLH